MSAIKQIFLDTETTGLEAERGHRIIEVVGLAYCDRRPAGGENFHQFCNPRRAIDADAQKVHGIDAEFLADKPEFSEIAAPLQEFLRGAEVIIHNAAFDRAFLNAEFARCKLPKMEEFCKIVCSLEMSRIKVPGLRHYRLEDLCKHFGVDDSARTTHNALLDAKLLAQVYFAMTREQMPMQMESRAPRRSDIQAAAILSRAPNAEELAAHESFLNAMEEAAKKDKDGKIAMPIWRE